MATWQEIGQDNFRAGRELFDAKRYRSSVSRLYAARIAADYQRRTTDRGTVQDALRDTAKLFQLSEIDHD